jgi:rare lipoprotein A
MSYKRIAALVVVSLLFLLPLAALESETGEASWYGPGFHGRRTANGEIFDKEALTAAHRTLPFGTVVRVRNLDNGRVVVVRINDRGPFARDRILDLSEAAARELDMMATGTAPVKLEILSAGESGTAVAPAAPPPPSPRVPAKVVRIQVASFRDAANAADTIQRLKLSGLSPSLETAGGYTRVVLADIKPDDANDLILRLSELGYPGVLVRVETRL